MNTKLKQQWPFDPYIAGRTAHLEVIVAQAISTIDASKYGLVTDYCKTLSMIITELRAAKAFSPSSPYYNKKLRPFSYVTLLRNETYRAMVDKAFGRSRAVVEEAEAEVDEDIEVLKLKVVSLLSQTNLLKDRIIALDAGRGLTAIDNVEADKIIAKLNHRVELLVRVNQEVLNSVSGAFKLIKEPEERFPVVGLYGPKGLVATLDDLDEMQKAMKEHPLTL